MKKMLFILFLTGLSFAVAAQQPEEVIHKVKRGETVYSIATEHHVTPEAIAAANPKVAKKMKVHVGQKVVIPIPVQVIKPKLMTPKDKKEKSDKVPAVTVPAKAEADKATPVIEPSLIKLKTSSGNPAEYPLIFGRYANGGFKMNRQRGAANFIEDNTSGNASLAFCNIAATGSIAKVMNMMNKKTTYVKIVGKLPAMDASQEIVIKLSRKTASLLGAVDEKFLVEVVGYTEQPPVPTSAKGGLPKK